MLILKSMEVGSNTTQIYWFELTRNTPAAYTKSNLNEFYLGDNSIKAIKEIYDCIDEGLANMSLF